MTESSTAARPRRAAKKSTWKTLLRDILVIFVVAVLVSFLIKTFVVRSFYIPSGSMENTLQVNDRIIVNELEPKLFPLQRGDVIVFKDPGGWLPPLAPKPTNPISSAVNATLDFVGLSASDSDQHLVKRLIGLPGDKVSCCNALGQMSVNGVPLKEPYVLLPAGVEAVSHDDFSVTVPAGAVWVMGDNRYNSADSRYHMDDPGKGFVPLNDVVGRAFVLSWPVDHWTLLSDYPEVFAGVDAAKAGH
ncbi:signal peptidase I [Leifsonia poae]|uniref:signal peptidase I n=1 Tax=Leifsonia poae TaxID=110933 RepID=UPI001CBDAEF9|nr:signal peptidase I [Leifsonia poae]